MYTIQAPLRQHQDNVDLSASGAMPNLPADKLAFGIGLGLVGLALGSSIALLIAGYGCTQLRKLDAQQHATRKAI